MVRRPTIELHIDELVLHGFSEHNQAQLVEAIEHEIIRVLQDRGLPAGLSADAAIGRLNAGTFTLQVDAKTEIVGQNIANSIYNGFTK